MSTKPTIQRNGMRLLLASGLLTSLLCSVASASTRIWHTKDGQRYEAEFLREKPGKVFLKGLDNQNFTLAVTNLVANDVKYIRTQVIPDVSIEFGKKLKERERSDYSRQTGHTIDVSAEVVVKRTSRAPFLGQFQGELYLISKEVKTDDYTMINKSGFVVRFPDESREFTFHGKGTAIHYEEYTTESRGATYEGYVVILYDLKGNVLEFDTNLSWISSENLGTLRELPAYVYFDKTLHKKSVPRPKSGYEGTDMSY